MAGFNSHDELVSEITTNGKFWRTDFMKNLSNIGTVVAGRWYDLTGYQGNPIQYLHGNKIDNGDLMASNYPFVLGSANWAYTAATHLLTRTANADLSTVVQNTRCIPGVTYTVLFTMTRSAGSLTVSLGGTAGTARSAAGTFREEIVCGATAGAPLTFTPDATFAGTIDLIGVFRQNDFHVYISEEECATYIGPLTTDGDTKHAINIGAFNNALLGSPAILYIVDMLGVYPSIKTNTALPQQLSRETRLRNGFFLGDTSGWTLGSNWAYGSNSVVRTSAANTATLSQVGIDVKANVPYTVKFTMSGTSGGGSITPSLCGVNGTARTADGTYEEIITPTSSYGDLVFTPTSGNIATTITDVIVKVNIPRYTDGAGVRMFMSTAFDTLPGANAQNLNIAYIPNGSEPTVNIVDNCDSTTGWSGNADATISLNTTTFTEGVGALNLAKTGTATATVTMTKTTPSIDFTNGRLRFKIYCVNAAAYAKLVAAGAALSVKYGSDASNYYRFDFTKAQLATYTGLGVGWQLLECSILTPTAIVGSPNRTACTYTQFNLTATGAAIVWSAGDFIFGDITEEVNARQLGATVSLTASSIASHILHSGTAAGNFGPFLPLYAGDSGVREVDTVTFSAASAAAGAVNLVLCKPLIEIPLPVGFVMTERDLLNQLPSLPKELNGACLGYILYCGAVTAAGTQYMGYIDHAWS